MMGGPVQTTAPMWMGQQQVGVIILIFIIHLFIFNSLLTIMFTSR